MNARYQALDIKLFPPPEDVVRGSETQLQVGEL